MYSTKILFQDHFKSLNSKLGIIDAGARGDLPDPWRFIPPQLLDVIGFEPDLNEQKILSAQFPERKYFPYALWNSNTEIPIHLNTVPATSSVCATHDVLAKEFEDVHFSCRKTEKTTQVRGATLDTLLTDSWGFDFFKIDTQGAEKMILEGASALLKKHKPIVITEAWNIEAYRGAPSAGSIITWMESQGYFVLDLEITANWSYRNKRGSQCGVGKGSKARASGVDLFFCPLLDSMSGLDEKTLIKRAGILELFGYRDLAIQIMESILLPQTQLSEALITSLYLNAESESQLTARLLRKVLNLLKIKHRLFAPMHD